MWAYQATAQGLLTRMHMITPGVAASLTPKSVERTESAPRARRRLHLPRAPFRVPHVHLPQRHA